jgi:hypothetical protein
MMQCVINKFRDGICNSARGRSWDAPPCWDVVFSLLSPQHKGRPAIVWQCLSSFGRTSMYPCDRRISGCAQNVVSMCTSSSSLNLRKPCGYFFKCRKLLLGTTAWVLLARLSDLRRPTFSRWRSTIRAKVNEHGSGCSLPILHWRSNSKSSLLCWGSEATRPRRLLQVAKETGISIMGIHHDKAPAHTAQRVQEFLAHHGTPVAQQPS